MRIYNKEKSMTICPIAVITSCSKCPAVNFCPLKTVLGDAKPEDETGKEEKAEKSSTSS